MALFRIEDLGDPRLADYRHVPDPELLRRGEIFVVEGRLVVRTLLTQSPFVARSLLVTPAAFDALRAVVEPRLGGLPVYIVDQRLIQQLTGFNIHRGCLAIGERPPIATLDEWLRGPRRSSLVDPASLGGKPDATSATPAAPVPPRFAQPVVVLEQIVNADNIGGIFRSAAAFGAAAVVLGPNCCDPLYRKAIRTSMGAALRVPFVHAGEWPAALAALRGAGFTVVALTPRADAVRLEEFVRHAGVEPATFVADGVDPTDRRIALLAGSEGPGLSLEALEEADVAVRIPMASGVDSLNVATAVGIALYRLAGGS